MGDVLEIVTLGGLELRHNRQLMTGFVSRKVEALVVYLACTRQMYPRDVLAELFWEGRTQAQSLANLRTVLNNLRQQLGTYFVITRRGVGVNPDSAFWLDLDALQAGVRIASQRWQQPGGLSLAVAAQVEQTLALYQGDFLAGFAISDSQGFEDWLLQERERLKHLVIQALHYLVEYYLESGAYSAGLTQVTRLLQLDPLREEAYRQVMRLLARSGQRKAALDQYETCRHLLREEFDVAPAQETAALYEAIRAEAGSAPGSQVSSPYARPPHNLPDSTTPFVGRTAELVHISHSLADPNCRLLTLVGAGGIGKTRLALQSAKDQLTHFRHGVYFVSLASVASPDFLPSSIASALNFTFNNVEKPRHQLVSYVRDKSLLIVLDNFEHLLDGAELVAELLAAAPDVKILSTSRERLNLREEWLLQLEGMDAPADGKLSNIEDFGAVQLFVQQARRVRAGFSIIDETDRLAVSHICRMVDGMPLAIELAAAWVHVISCELIARQIANNLDFLTTTLRNVPERHRSLRAVFERSWTLLSAPEREALQRLAVFRGGFTLDAVEKVADASDGILRALVDKSLVQPATSRRFGMHELLRQFALHKLQESGQLSTVQARHVNFFRALAEDAAPKLHGPERVAWVERLTQEHDNIRAALQWCRGDNHKLETELRLSHALLWFWIFHNAVNEGHEWLKGALMRCDATNPSLIQAWALTSTGALAWYRGDFASAVDLFDRSVTLFRTFDDRRGLGTALYCQGVTLLGQGKPSAAHPACAEAVSLLRQTEAGFDLRLALTILGEADASLGDDASAQDRFAEALRLARQNGDKRMVAVTLNYLGGVLCRRGELITAQSTFEESLAIWRELGEQYGLARTLREFGDVTLALGDYERTAELYNESLALSRETRHPLDIAASLFGLGRALQALGDNMQATALFTESLTVYNAAAHTPGVVDCLVKLAGLAQDRGMLAATVRILSLANVIGNPTGGVQPWVSVTHFDQALAQLRDQLDESTFAASWEEGQVMTIVQVIGDVVGSFEFLVKGEK